jgi:membrane fusion protein, multidrug efflux system
MEEPKSNELSKGRDRARRGRWPLLVLIVCIAAAAALYAWSRSGRTTAAQTTRTPPVRSIPVAAVPAKIGDMNIYINGLGSVVPLNTVTVRSRVDGQLMEVLFKEGQEVKKGQILATIDPRPFEVQLTQAEGQMARDQAQLKNSRIDLERYRVLWQQDSIPKQQLDTQEALVRQNEGAIKTDQGQIDSAKLQLTYSRIVSPIDGRVGLRLVDPGNIVHASDQNGLLVITQLHPITVIFPIPEDSLPPVITALNKGRKMPVDVYNREQTQKLATGLLLTADNQIDPTTGTVRLKAIFENRESSLFPNQFVNARLLINVLKETVLVPTSAIQRGPQGTYVYVVKADRTVTIRPVTIGNVQGGEASVSTGLADGEPVVVEGAERLREGAKVEMRGQGAGPRGPVGTGGGANPGNPTGKGAGANPNLPGGTNRGK